LIIYYEIHHAARVGSIFFVRAIVEKYNTG
jgi:hypothetical protein